ncbi:MAG: signal peptidase II [Deltaproteobacteria bacterium]|nr:signal peptidase II [Deltaproteobacteria bacterium]
MSRWRLVLGLSLLVLVADQWTKMLAVLHLTPGIATAHSADKGERLIDRAHQRDVVRELSLFEAFRRYYFEVEAPCESRGSLCPEVQVIDGFWSWRYAENRGAAFSLFAKMGKGLRLPFLLTVTTFGLAFLLSYVRKLRDDQQVLMVALSLILGGGLGNLVDRTHFGYVVDFVLWYYGTFRWPIFNVADTAIVTGGCLIGLVSLLELAQARRKGHAGVAEPRTEG